MNDKVGIIFSTYNNGKIASLCLRSCLDQTYSNIRVVVADDGSTDDTVDYLEEIANDDKRVKLLKLTHGERGIARERAFYHVQLNEISYVYIIDSDMMLDKSLVEKSVSFLETYSNVGALVIPEEPFSEHKNLFSKIKVFERTIINNAGENVDGNSIEAARFWRIEEYNRTGGINPSQIAFEETQPTIRYLLDGGKIKRATFTKVVHDEKKVTLRNLLNKKAYYFLHMQNTIKMESSGKWKALKRWYFFRSVLYRKDNLKEYLKHPILSVGMVFMYISLSFTGVYVLLKRKINV